VYLFLAARVGQHEPNRLMAAQNAAVPSAYSECANLYGCWTYIGTGNRTAESW
jgi:hypothetical protein